VNHHHELDEDVLNALERLRSFGISILTQTVLLRGVNDSFDSLHSLFTVLGNSGIIPYYLHQLDRAQGTAHFEVPLEKGLRLMDDLRGSLSGYLVLRYVQEVEGEMSKRVMKV
jgi:L-lysine 2,3-aminomutase